MAAVKMKAGYIIAERVAKVGPVVPGRVSKVHVKEGQTVTDVVDEHIGFVIAALTAVAPRIGLGGPTS